jgi:hypothetical protein
MAHHVLSAPKLIWRVRKDARKEYRNRERMCCLSTVDHQGHTITIKGTRSELLAMLREAQLTVEQHTREADIIAAGLTRSKSPW